MQEFGGYGVSLLVALLAVLSSGREIEYKYACLGDTTEMFQDITFHSGNEDVRLYRNGLWSSTIAMWHKQNDTLISSIVPGYKQRVFLDEYGSIWIRNIHLSDEGKYFIKQVIYSSLTTTEMHIYVLVPPNNHCRPNIMHLDNVLTVYLDSQDCGSPVPDVRWLNHPGISHASNSLAKLRPGNDAGTYYACSEGPALRCLKTSSALDFCTAFTIAGSNSPPGSLDIPDMKTVTALLGIIIVLILVTVITALVVAIICKRNVRKYRAATSILGKRMERPGSVKAALNVPPSCFKEICYEV